ncbi:Protein kinase-like domain [Pseudocohnilembus persalinus]|uniref:Protein kinase-like domain n=1 Tax=Pseudocohnilembus persalinus TaxID=266149 RepID=A0A0V0QYQ2_PSEPJ|nr:Protein kinase-like domain [Pseudocohnilembus persalinus]|eukprot:KRX07447.1 Protein kinase-like domain [Pseudocohnilembus persalinus]
MLGYFKRFVDNFSKKYNVKNSEKYIDLIHYDAEGKIFESKYILKDIIGKSNYEVYQCISKNNKNNCTKEYACKVIKYTEQESQINVEKSEECFKKYFREIYPLSCKKKYIVKIYEIFIGQQEMKIIMEKCDTNLQIYIDKYLVQNQYNPKMIDLLKICLQISKAIKFLKEKGLAHRDIKPENILVKQQKQELQIKLTDFGLSKEPQKKDNQYTQNQTLCGTAGYQSPEIHQEIEYNPFKNDIYSLGSTFFSIFSKINCIVIKQLEKNQISDVDELNSQTDSRIQSSILKQIRNNLLKKQKDIKADFDISELLQGQFQQTNIKNYYEICELTNEMLSFYQDKRPTIEKVVDRLQHQIKGETE